MHLRALRAYYPGRRLHRSDPWHLLHGRDARRRDSQGQDGQQMGGAEVTIRIALKINWLLKNNCTYTNFSGQNVLLHNNSL